MVTCSVRLCQLDFSFCNINNSSNPRNREFKGMWDIANFCKFYYAKEDPPTHIYNRGTNACPVLKTI